MSKRISKAVREEAAELCAVIATAEFAPNHAVCPCLMCVEVALEPSPAALSLARKAWASAPVWPDAIGEGYGLRYAEAECLLRMGWVP